MIDVVDDFGAVGDGVTDNATAFSNAISFCVNTGDTLHIPTGDFFVGGTLTPPTGALVISGVDAGASKVIGNGLSDFLKVSGRTSVSAVSVGGFRKAFDVVGAGDFSLVNSEVSGCEYLLTGSIDAERVTISGNHLHAFSRGLVLCGSSAVSDAVYFCDNIIHDVARYVYRLSHDAPLHFDRNTIYNIHCNGFSGSSGVARIVMPGSTNVNYIRDNHIKDVVSTDADCVLLYWSQGDAVVSGNTIGGFRSDDECHLIKEKSSLQKGLDFSGNMLLGGADASHFDIVVSLLTDAASALPRRIANNRFDALNGVGVRFFGQGSEYIPGHTIIEGNIIFEMDGPCFVGSVSGCNGVTVHNNRCFKHTNGSHLALTGSQRQKAIFTHYSASDYGVASGVTVEGNEWVFSTDGETSGPYPTAPVCYAGLSAAPQGAARIRALRNTVTGSEAWVTCSGSAGGATVFASGNIAMGGLSVGPKSGTAAAQALVSLQEHENTTEVAGVYTTS